MILFILADLRMVATVAVEANKAIDFISTAQFVEEQELGGATEELEKLSFPLKPPMV
jgi:hypothetical protein